MRKVNPGSISNTLSDCHRSDSLTPGNQGIVKRERFPVNSLQRPSKSSKFESCNSTLMSSGFTPWDKYWDKKYTVEVPERGNFNVYANYCDSKYFVVCVHGAGHCGLSFSLMAKLLKGKLSICALDLKCHGDTPGDVTKDLEIESMVEDVTAFCQTVQPPNTQLIVIGHSMGGGIVA